MRTLNNILVPVDVMEPSGFFIEYAKMMAEKFGSKITLMYARPPLDRFYDVYLTDDVVAKLKSDAKERALVELNEIAERQLQGIDISIKIRRGQPQDMILEMIEKGDYDMIIMGTHCRRGVERMLFGSVASRVVRHSPLPVLTIHPEECKR